MMVVIMGCGRVGAAVATRLAEEGHAVTVLDTDGFAFSDAPFDGADDLLYITPVG